MPKFVIKENKLTNYLAQIVYGGEWEIAGHNFSLSLLEQLFGLYFAIV